MTLKSQAQPAQLDIKKWGRKSLEIREKLKLSPCPLPSRDGLIRDICLDSQLSSLDFGLFEKVVDVGGKSLVPGFVDGHTHPVWAGERVHEFAMKVIKIFCCFGANEVDLTSGDSLN